MWTMSKDTLHENTPQMRTLRRAVTACGGLPALAKALDVSLGDLAHWLEGQLATPNAVFIKALDLVAGLGPVRSVKRGAKT
jgi:hypothetical protein